MPSEFLTGSSAAAGVALVTMFVSLGGLAGPYAFGYIRHRTGSFYDALAVAGMICFVFAILVLLLPKNGTNPSDGAVLPGSRTS